mmetsp:Transcript_141314/g.367881  ORF Transcript_141314/g.367881 Transcript_141314/m.367881 type:complete len:212 (-) Transcript_141314:106-741(-)
MGAEQTRCCGACDREHQLKFGGGGDRQAYSAWEDEHGQEAVTAQLASIEGPAGHDPADCSGGGGGNWGHCCSEPSDQMPRTPPAAGMKDAGEGGLSRPGEASAAAGRGHPVERELLVEIAKRRPKDDLGMKVLHRNIGVMVVAEIYSGGAVEAANQANARAGRECLEVNDLIVTVNGVGGDDAAMADECKRSQHLTLGVRRGALSSPVLPS